MSRKHLFAVCPGYGDSHWFQLVPNSGTIWNMTPTERRPRIPVDLAHKIDGLREDVPFETFVRDVLTRYVSRYYRDRLDSDKAPTGAKRIHVIEDPDGAFAWLDKIEGGWGDRKREGIIAGLAVEDDGYEAVGIHLDKTNVRALRDALTELLGEYER